MNDYHAAQAISTYGHPVSQKAPTPMAFTRKTTRLRLLEYTERLG